MSEEIAIKVEAVYKDFALPHEKANSLKSSFLQQMKGSKRSVERQHALKDISFEVKKGEFFGIVGRNGSGKSTMLKILAQIYKPSRGEVKINGKLVPFIELGVGFNPELTGRDNVYLSASLIGFSKKEIDRMYNDVVEFAELENFMDQKLKNYSSGMQVRLAFSIATRAKADILLVDEVLAVGDADFQRKCFDHFQKLKGGGTTVVFVSHSMNAVREYCDRALLIDDSRVVEIGVSDKIAKLYSQMFVKESSVDEYAKNSKRWGNNQIVYKSVAVSADLLAEQKELTIDLVARANQDLEGAIFGFTIKNGANQSIMGTNTNLEGKRVTKLVSNEEVTISWVIPNIFSDGRYTIDITALLLNGQESDWWEDAHSFRVLKAEEHAHYLVDPPVKLRVTKK